MEKINKKVDRRAALVHAAYGVIAQKGFEGLRLREVATKAGIDHSTLHHHFRTKRDLIGAVLDYATEQFRSPARADGATPTSLHDHLSLLGQMIVNKPDLHVVLREFDLHATRNGRVRALITEREEGWRKGLAQRIQIAAKEGNWALRFQTGTCAELIIAVVKGASFSPRSASDVLNLLEKLLGKQSADRKTRGKRP
jgi:AcrR family transcriptional regulator